MLYEWRIECYIINLTFALMINCHSDHIVIQLQGCVYDTHTCTLIHVHVHIQARIHTHTHTHTLFVLVCSKNGYKQYLDYLFLVLNDQKLLQPITEDGLVAMVRG